MAVVRGSNPLHEVLKNVGAQSLMRYLIWENNPEIFEKGGTKMDKITLVVTSKVKARVKESAELKTSAEAIDALSARVEELIDEAILNAKVDGRKTIKARDFE